MAFSFSADLSNDVSQVRQKLGDTIDAGHLVEDETITALVTTKGSVLAAAAELAGDLAARFARLVDTDVDGQNQMLSQRYRAFRELAARLASELASASAATAQPIGGQTFCGVGAFGCTAQEVVDARCDPTAAANAPLRWG